MALYKFADLFLGKSAVQLKQSTVWVNVCKRSEGDLCMCAYDNQLTGAIVLAGDTIKAGQTESLLNVRR